jgi:hypothetical protein
MKWKQNFPDNDKIDAGHFQHSFISRIAAAAAELKHINKKKKYPGKAQCSKLRHIELFSNFLHV